MDKAFTNFEWKNFPNTTTPINATNLNKINNAIDTIDDRVIALQKVEISQDVTLSTSQTTTVTFTNSAIKADSTIECFTTNNEMEYESMTTSNGSCVIVLPKYSSEESISIKIRIS